MPTNTSPIHNILIVGPTWVGDMVMAQTLFMQLKTNNPNVNKAFSELENENISC